MDDNSEIKSIVPVVNYREKKIDLVNYTQLHSYTPPLQPDNTRIFFNIFCTLLSDIMKCLFFIVNIQLFKFKIAIPPPGFKFTRKGFLKKKMAFDIFEITFINCAQVFRVAI